MNKQQPKWKKPRGYVHVSPSLSPFSIAQLIKQKVTKPDYVKKHAFMPLLHVVLKQRRFKKSKTGDKNAHSHWEGNIKKGTAKERPLHYASHLDALIFGKYAEEISDLYEQRLTENPTLSDAITAYRKIPTLENPEKNKSTIHFAKEVFEEVKRRCEVFGECTVMAFDIKSFFSSLDHNQLKAQWTRLLGTERLPEDHYNVFKAATQFSYIFLKDLKTGARGGWDESALEKIRRDKGYSSLFSSYRDFREQLKQKKFRLHKYPFHHPETGVPIGIPQGLPISAALANLYLSEFDEQIISKLVIERGAFYRRYSDDIVIISEGPDVDSIETLVQSGIGSCNLKISPEKTEIFKFTIKQVTKQGKVTCNVQHINGSSKSGKGFTYLGFTFDGQHILIKSANISRYYRRLIKQVKSKAHLTLIAHQKNPTVGPAIFTRQLLRMIEHQKRQYGKLKTHSKRLVRTELHGCQYVVVKRVAKSKGSFLNYAKRATAIMGEPAIEKQLRNRRNIFGQAVRRHFLKKVSQINVL